MKMNTFRYPASFPSNIPKQLTRKRCRYCHSETVYMCWSCNVHIQLDSFKGHHFSASANVALTQQYVFVRSSIKNRNNPYLFFFDICVNKLLQTNISLLNLFFHCLANNGLSDFEFRRNRHINSYQSKEEYQKIILYKLFNIISNVSLVYYMSYYRSIVICHIQGVPT